MKAAILSFMALLVGAASDSERLIPDDKKVELRCDVRDNTHRVMPASSYIVGLGIDPKLKEVSYVSDFFSTLWYNHHDTFMNEYIVMFEPDELILATSDSQYRDFGLAYVSVHRTTGAFRAYDSGSSSRKLASEGVCKRANKK
jgi:hypothetical protein